MQKETKMITAFVVISIAIPLSLLEAYLRISGVNATYEEQIGLGSYTSPYTPFKSTERYPLHEPNTIKQYKQQEFTRYIHSNSIGFNDKEWSMPKRKKRLFCLGDSFTEGIGSTGDSSYPKILQTIVPDSIEVCNAGISGFDPMYSYKILTTKLLPYQPDIVVVAVNQTDIMDCITRGGIERFSQGIADKNPWWDVLYGKSYIVRYLIHNILKYNRLFLLPQEQIAAENRALDDIINVVDSFQTTCKSKQVELFILFHPSRQEVKDNKIECQKILTYCNNKNIRVINVLNYFKENGVDSSNIDNLHWKIDGHYKNIGYKFMAEAVCEAVLKDEKK